MNIAFVAYRGNMVCGGQGIYLWFLARELSRLGHTVDVFCGPPYPDPMPFAREVTRLKNEQYWARWFARDAAGFVPRAAPLGALSPLNFYELLASRLGFLPEPLAFSLRALAALTKKLRAGRRYDLVHDVQCLGYGLLPLRALGLPVLSTVHHPLSMDRRASFLRDQTLRDRIGTVQFYPLGMQAFVARRLDGILTSSEASARAIRRDFGVRGERIAMVGNGLDTDLFAPAGARADAQPAPAAGDAARDARLPASEAGAAHRDAGELLCVGRAADPNKGVRILLEALTRLPRARLTLVDGAQSSARRWARELGVSARVEVTGRVSQQTLVALYRRAALVVVPSRFEGFGLPAVEAMACGTAVVATRAGALVELLERTGGGVLVPRDDPAALASEIFALLKNATRRRALARRGRESVVEAYGWRRVAERTCEAYRAILARRSNATVR